MAESKSITFELNESVLTAQVGRLDEMAMVVERRFSELKMTIEDVGNADPGSKISESLGGLQSGLGTISSALDSWVLVVRRLHPDSVLRLALLVESQMRLKI